MHRTILAIVCALFVAVGAMRAQERVDGYLISDKQTIQSNAVHDYIGLYQKYVSGLKSGRCAMYPSCSNYGLQVFGEYPFFKAMAMTSDRLIRCSHDQHLYDKTHIYGLRSCVDNPDFMPVPVSNAGRLYTETRRWPDARLQFVDYLINESDYSSALLEIRRIEFMDNVFIPQLYAKKLLCMRALGMHEEAIFDYETLKDSAAKSNNHICMQAALTYYETRNYEETINKLNVLDAYGDSVSYYNQYILRGITQGYMEEYDNAVRSFEQAAQYNPSTYERNIALLDQLSKQKKKNPTVAKYLSIIPGLGYLYSGHKGSALTSLLVNGALGYATYTSIKSQNYGIAGLCGLFTVSFYIGNISGASRSATRYNEAKKRNVIKQLESINHIHLIN